jgi:hypothetical protein
MGFMLIFLVPVGLLVVWAVVFDLRRRRRRAPGQDVGSAARRARAEGEARGGPGGF